LLLPRRDPGRRSPLWQQRQRASQLLEVAREFPDFPIVLETVREVLSDVYDLPSLLEVTAAITQRSIRLIEVETNVPSPFARSLLFGYVAAFLYEGDSPLAERRAAALSIDPALLAELLGRAELREVLDPVVIEQTEAELQRLAPDRRARDAEGVVDLLRILGPLSIAEVDDRTLNEVDVTAALELLARTNRVFTATIAGDARWAVVEDAARLRDALGTPIPHGVPSAFLDPVPDPIGDLMARFARTHTPFAASEAAARYGVGVAVATDALRRLAADRRVIEGEFRPGASGTEWVDAEVLRRLRSRSLAALRKEIEPVTPGTLGRFLPVWQHVGSAGHGATSRRPALQGIDGVLQAIEQLQGVALPASAWETLVLPSRVTDYSPAWLDELCASGEVVWAGGGGLPRGDGWVSLHLTGAAPLSLPDPDDFDLTERQQRMLDALAGGGGFFFRQLVSAMGDTGDDAALVAELWQLVWGGHLTNDTLAPLRATLGGTATRRPAPRTRGYRGYARPASVTQSGPPTAAGRWSLLPERDADTTRRTAFAVDRMLDRHGVVTRGAVQAEGLRGGFALAYSVLARMEEAGSVRRGYVVEGLGAAQFATPATVDRVRSFSRDADAAPALARPRQPLRRSARVARESARCRVGLDGASPRAQGRGPRRPRRRAPRGIPRARGKERVDVHRRARGARESRDRTCCGCAHPAAVVTHRARQWCQRVRHRVRRGAAGSRLRGDTAGSAHQDLRRTDARRRHRSSRGGAPTRCARRADRAAERRARSALRDRRPER
jgi:ATP-dependent Lhr-like helicase